MSSRKILVGALSLSALVFAGSVASAEEELVWKIAFVSTLDDEFDLQVMNADGSNLLVLTQTPETRDHYFAEWSWSPDGSRIVYAYSRSIYVMNRDGSDPTNLTEEAGENWAPEWSYDGSQIGFMSYRDGDYDLFVMNPDGSEPTNLTPGDGDAWHYTWFPPDGSLIAFSSGRAREGVPEIYVMNADGSAPTRPRPAEEMIFEEYPRWSLDGMQLAFSRSSSGGLYTELVVMDSDGSGAVVLAGGTSRTFPQWSPDGSQLAFESGPDIHVVNSDGTGETNLTANLSRRADRPRWSPDGEQLAFRYDDQLLDERIYVMDADGSDPTNLSGERAGSHSRPQWSPVKLPVPEPSLPAAMATAAMSLLWMRRRRGAGKRTPS